MGIFYRHCLFLFFFLILLSDFCHMTHRDVLLLHHVKWTLKVVLFDFGFDLVYLIAKWGVRLHYFESSFNFEMKVSLRDINEVIPQGMLVMFEEKGFEVLLVRLCRDEQHNETVVSITIVLFVYTYRTPTILAHVVFSNQPHQTLIQHMLGHACSVFYE